MRMLTRFDTENRPITDYSRLLFAEPGDKDIGTLNIKHRIKVIKEFLPFDIGKVKSLDIGSSNALSRTLGITCHTADFDLNQHFVANGRKFDFILCSEVLEHMVSPFRLMAGIYEHLKPGGYCLVTTPLANWTTGFVFHSPWHFTEYKKNPLWLFFLYMGFEVIKYRKYQAYDLPFIFRGIRPILRVLFQRNQMWLLRKPHEHIRSYTSTQ